jgi:hypothetical protein
LEVHSVRVVIIFLIGVVMGHTHSCGITSGGCTHSW